MARLDDILRSHGVPTAQQEALQAPAVDPVVTLANAAAFGPMAAGKGLLAQILLSATGGWGAKGQAAQYSAPPQVAQQGADKLRNYLWDKMASGVLSKPNLRFEDWDNLANNQLRNLDIAFNPNWEAQVHEALKAWKVVRQNQPELDRDMLEQMLGELPEP